MKPVHQVHQCEHCQKVFSMKANLRRHIRNFHEIVQISKNVIQLGQGSFICNFCNGKFTRKDNLIDHLRRKHPSSEAEKPIFICEHCSHTFVKKCGLIKHLRKHDANEIKEYFQYETVNLTFDSKDDFLKWKTQIEKELFCKYNIYRRYKGKFHETNTYICHRSGYCKKIEERKRRPTMRGSKKVGNCPSRIIVNKRSDSTLHVKFIKTHLYHKCEPSELKHVRISSELRDWIRTKLSAGIPSHHILKKVRCELELNNSLELKEKIQLLTAKDIRNIASLKNVKNDGKHPNDMFVTRSHGIENEEFILYYKKRGCIDPQNILLLDDFVVIIMKDYQEQKLREFGSDIICFDVSHGTNGFDFLLHTLLVIDEYAEGFPCIFMISNRNDAVVCEIMITCILNKIGKIKTKTLMSDMQLSYQNAWLKVMPEPDYLLFCPWHVQRTWTKKLSALIQDPVKRKEIKTDLDQLQTSMSVKDFDAKLSYFLSKNDPKINSFIDYFRSNYSTNYQMWAFSYTVHAGGINTNMHIERFHRTLRDEFANAKQISRIQDICKILVDYITNRKGSDLIYKTKGKISHTTEKSKVSHDRAVKLLEENGSESNVRICDDGTFNVNTYTITRVSRNCDGTCPQMCEICEICPHKFTCSCTLNSKKKIMCEHIHLVGLHTKKITIHSQPLSPSISLPSLCLPDPDIPDEADLEEREMLDLEPERANDQPKGIDNLKKYFEETLQSIKNDQQLEYAFNMMKKINLTIHGVDEVCNQ